jgi:hypothetical protein
VKLLINDDVVMFGHDVPAHLAITERRVKLFYYLFIMGNQVKDYLSK